MEELQTCGANRRDTVVLGMVVQLVNMLSKGPIGTAGESEVLASHASLSELGYEPK